MIQRGLSLVADHTARRHSLPLASSLPFQLPGSRGGGGEADSMEQSQGQGEAARHLSAVKRQAAAGPIKQLHAGPRAVTRGRGTDGPGQALQQLQCNVQGGGNRGAPERITWHVKGPDNLFHYWLWKKKPSHMHAEN